VEAVRAAAAGAWAVIFAALAGRGLARGKAALLELGQDVGRHGALLWTIGPSADHRSNDSPARNRPSFLGRRPALDHWTILRGFLLSFIFFILPNISYIFTLFLWSKGPK
jgi:hypothetical protein